MRYDAHGMYPVSQYAAVNIGKMYVGGSPTSPAKLALELDDESGTVRAATVRAGALRAGAERAGAERAGAERA